jgi:IS5 family transposase
MGYPCDLEPGQLPKKLKILIPGPRPNSDNLDGLRTGGGKVFTKVPDDKTMGRLGRQMGPAVVAKVHDRVVAIARENRVATGRKLRVDTTVVETNIHYPTDSSLLGDGVRVLTRVMQRVCAVAGAASCGIGHAR